MCVCVHVRKFMWGLCTWVQVFMKPEKGIRCPRTGVTYRWLCEPQMWVLRSKLGSCGTLCALNHWSHLPNPRKVFQILCYLKNILASLGICSSFTYIGNKTFQCIISLIKINWGFSSTYKWKERRGNSGTW